MSWKHAWQTSPDKMRRGGKLGGRIAVESGQLARLQQHSRETGQFSRMGKIGGKIGGPISGRIAVESGQLASIAPKGGRTAMELGHWARAGAIGRAHRYGYEAKPGLWLSRKTGKVLLDQRKEKAS